MVHQSSPAEALEKNLRLAIQKKFRNISHADLPKHLLETPKIKDFGDYSCAVPLRISKIVSRKPYDVAQDILENLKVPDEFLKPEIKDPGFVNFSFSPEFLSGFVSEAARNDENFGRINIGKSHKAIIEYSDPNIAKPLGVHHILATIIGQALSNLHRFLGYDVTAVNYTGDWGTQFGKLLYALKTWGDQKNIEKNPIQELLKLYVKFHEEVEKNPSIEEKGREEFAKLEAGDRERLKLWEWIRKISLEDTRKTYDLLGGIHFDLTRGESFYRDKMEPILEKGKKLGVFQKGEKDALLVFFEHEKYPPFMIQKSDEATLYSTRDLAVIDERLKTKPLKVLYVVDSAQKLYFEQLFETARLLGYDTESLHHVIFGRMSFPEGKMSTRKGTVVLLDEVIQEAGRRSRKIVEEKNPDLPEEEKAAVARKVGVGALKFAVLNQNRETNVKFTWEKMLSLEGESAPYLQYVYARCRSILRKAEAERGSGKKSPAGKSRYVFRETSELALARFFPKFTEVLARSAEEYRPNHLARFLAELAAAFNGFYDTSPVLKSEPDVRKKRLELTKAVSAVLKNGLSLLGIEVSERM